MLGAEDIIITFGETYNDAGATASDINDENIEVDITNDIIVVNNVNTNVLGTYQITYNVEDAYGNSADERSSRLVKRGASSMVIDSIDNLILLKNQPFQ